MAQTDVIGTSRQQSLVYSVMAEIALSGLPLFRIIRDGLKGARLKTQRAAYAGLGIQDHQPVTSLSNGFHRTDLRTRRLIAMTAAMDVIIEGQAPFDYFRTILGNGNIFYPLRGLIFLFAGHFAAFTPPTGILVDKEVIGFHGLFPSSPEIFYTKGS
jgi:hypothetical protein